MSITSSDLKKYSTFESVKNRPDNLLEMDIIEAETHIEGRIENPISEYAPLPTKLQLALLKVAQFFALANSDESMVKGYKSEKIGDYSYTLADGSSLTMPDVTDLIAEFTGKEEPGDSGLFLRMRAL